MEFQINVNLVYCVRSYFTIKLRDCFSFCTSYRYCSLFRHDRHLGKNKNGTALQSMKSFLLE